MQIALLGFEPATFLFHCIREKLSGIQKCKKKIISDGLKMSTSKRKTTKDIPRYSSIFKESILYRLATYLFVLTKPCMATGVIMTVVGYTSGEPDSIAFFRVLGPVMMGLAACFFLVCGTVITPQYQKYCSELFRQKGASSERLIKRNVDSSKNLASSTTRRDDSINIAVVTPQGNSGSLIFPSKSSGGTFDVKRDP